LRINSRRGIFAPPGIDSAPPEIDFAPPEKIVPPVAKKYYMQMADTMVKSLKQYSLHDLELDKV